MANIYGPGDLTDYLINFVNHLDPDGPTVLPWPKYDTHSAKLLTLVDGATPQEITRDTFRKAGIAFAAELGFSYPI